MAAGEEVHLRIKHLNFFIQLAEAAKPQLYGSEQEHWLASAGARP